MKGHATMDGRNILMRLPGLALLAVLFGFNASPAMALSITSTYTEVVSASLGTPSPIMGAGRLGGQLGSSLVAGFPKATALGNSFWPTTPGMDVTADGSRKLEFDDGGIKAIAAPVGNAVALTGTHRLDVFFADAQLHQSGPEPARLLFFGATLVALGLVVRRRMRRAARHNV
jgi:hypothetical protein